MSHLNKFNHVVSYPQLNDKQNYHYSDRLGDKPVNDGTVLDEFVPHVSILGAAWDIGTSVFGSSLGPAVFNSRSHLGNCIDTIISLQRSSSSTNNSFAHPAERSEFIIASTRDLCLQLAKKVSATIKHNSQFCVIGGDHSCAIGTWQGVADALEPDQPFGLIWIDAHLDAHTPQTSISGNLHGMPLAVLLGHGHTKLYQLLVETPALKAQHVAIIGARKSERAEFELLHKLGVHLYFMPEVEKYGLDFIIKEARELVTSGGVHPYGISIDLDAVNPTQAPGVNTPENGGLDAQELLAALNLISKHEYHQTDFLGLEIAEYNPLKDRDFRTLRLMDGLFTTLFTEHQLQSLEGDDSIYSNREDNNE